jgi:hypothetical protein
MVGLAAGTIWLKANAEWSYGDQFTFRAPRLLADVFHPPREIVEGVDAINGKPGRIVFEGWPIQSGQQFLRISHGDVHGEFGSPGFP